MTWEKLSDVFKIWWTVYLIKRYTSFYTWKLAWFFFPVLIISLAWVVRVIWRIRRWRCSVHLTADKTIKLWKISERDKRPEGYNLKEEDGRYRDAATITSLRVSHARLKNTISSKNCPNLIISIILRFADFMYLHYHSEVWGW